MIATTVMRLSVMRRTTLLALLFLALVARHTAADIYADINDHIQNRRLSEARSLIQSALHDTADDPTLYLQLSAIFEYQGDHRAAIDTLQSGVQATNRSHELFYYNIGNNYFSLRQYAAAEEAYSLAAVADSAYEPIYINRANTRVWREDYVGAIEDYTLYLSVAPQGTHRAEVRRMIVVLRNLLAAEEAQERERALREKRLLDEALRILDGSHTEGIDSRAPAAAIDELDVELDIVE